MNKVDAMGKQCPIPLIMTKNEIAKNGEGEYLVLVDNEIAVQNLEKMAKQYAFDYSFEKIDDAKFEVKLKVNDASVVEAVTLEQDAGETACGPAVTSENTVVVYKSEHMGHGNVDLGTVLVKGSIYAFSQLPNPPKTFLFYNSGVKLACTGSDSIEDLKNLEKAGVKIFACGTCLNHYGLQDNLEVGEVTNMYDIVDALNNAAKIIIP